ncbi:MAG TPA: hypothetical protein VJN18_22850 [Polyangiaceae bacterium]|nr:hypothetical protein [Polyangiaceae bacterium]
MSAWGGRAVTPFPYSSRWSLRVPLRECSCDQLLAGGYRDISFERHDVDICIGRELDEAIDFAIALGPAGEIIRLAGDFGREKTPEIVRAMREALAPYVTLRGVYAPSSAWLITART